MYWDIMALYLKPGFSPYGQKNEYTLEINQHQILLLLC